MNYLKEELKKRHMTQKEFAIRCGLSETAVSGYINERYRPRLKTIYKMSIVLGIETYEIVKGIYRWEE